MTMEIGRVISNRLHHHGHFDRDRLADFGLPDFNDRVGAGPHAIDEAEVLAQ